MELVHKTDTKDDALNSIMLSNNEKRRKISMMKQKYKYKEINQSPNKWKKKTAKIPNKRLDVLLKQHEQKNYCGRFCYCSPVANRKRKSTAHKETNKGSCRRVGYIGLTACVQNPIYIYIYILKQSINCFCNKGPIFCIYLSACSFPILSPSTPLPRDNQVLGSMVRMYTGRRDQISRDWTCY